MPITIGGITNMIKSSAGFCHTVLLINDGTVWTFGHNGYRQLGNGTNINSNNPVLVNG